MKAGLFLGLILILVGVLLFVAGVRGRFDQLSGALNNA